MDRKPYDAYARLEAPAAVLGYALTQWEGRDDTKAQPEVRRAANTAMDTIDAMMHELYVMRSRLIGEIRSSDDESMRRTEALLAECRARRTAHEPAAASLT